MNPIIRKLKKEDANELAYNIASVWNDTYQGIVDDNFLKRIYDHQKDSAKRLEKQAEENLNYYVLELNKKIIGWIYYDYDSSNYENAAEINSLYILKEYQKKGYGKLLLNYAIDDIIKNNIHKLVIGCLDKNPSNEFYKYMGGKYIGNQLFREQYIENMYLFEI